MSHIAKIQSGMPVVSVEGRTVGYVVGVDADYLVLTDVKHGCGFEHVIPLAWVEAVDRYVFLSRSRRYVEANRHAVVRGMPRAARQIAA